MQSAIVWVLYGCVVYRCASSRGLSIAYALASLTLVGIALQRWMQYGIRGGDLRTLLSLAIGGVQVIGCAAWAMERRGATTTNNRSTSQQPLLTPTSDDNHNPTQIPLPPDGDEGAGILSRLFFCWTNPLIKKGYHGQLNGVEDLFHLPPSLRVLRVERQFLENAPSHFTDAETFSFSRALFKSFGKSYIALGLLRLFGDAMKFAGPVMLHLLITCLESGDPNGIGHRIVLAMMAAAFFSALCDFNFNFYIGKIGIRVRCTLQLAVYDKLLQVPQCRLSAFSTGQLINFASTDIERIVGVVNAFHSLWSMPLNIAIALFLLYREMGAASLAGLLAATLLLPVNRWIAVRIGTMSERMLHHKDQRIKVGVGEYYL